MKWENLKPIVVLTAICVIVSAALAGTYSLTRPRQPKPTRRFPLFCPMVPILKK